MKHFFILEVTNVVMVQNFDVLSKIMGNHAQKYVIKLLYNSQQTLNIKFRI